MENLEIALEDIEKKLDKATATILATDDPEKRHFIARAALAAVALFLLEKYGEGYLEGLGLLSLARSHGDRTRKFLTKIRNGFISEPEIEEEKKYFDLIMRQITTEPLILDAKAKAETLLQQILIEAGATLYTAESTADMLTATLFPTKPS